MNLTYFLVTVVLTIIFFIIDGISHERFERKWNIFFHISGFLILCLFVLKLFIDNFKFSILIYPGIIIILSSFFIIYRSFLKVKDNFLRAKKIVNRGIYSKVRHPMNLGLILFFTGLALLSSSLIIALYSLIAILMTIWLSFYEERSLIKRFGKEYLNYKKHVPMLIPGL